MKICRGKKFFDVFDKLCGICFAVYVCKGFFVEALHSDFKLNGAFWRGIQYIYGFFVKNIAGNFKMETDVFGNSFPMFRNNKSPEFFCPGFIGVKSAINEFYGLGSAFCKKEHFLFCSFDIKKSYAAASSGKTECTGIGASAARFKIGYSSAERGKIFIAIGRRGFAFGNIRFARYDFVFIFIKYAGNIKTSVCFYCVAK